MSSSFSVYNSYIRKISYNFLFSIILLIGYEVILLFSPAYGGMQIMNGVDVWFTYLFNLIPFGTWIISALIIVAGIIVIVKDVREGTKLKKEYFLLMFLESCAWSILIYMAFPMFLGALFRSQVGVPGPLSFLEAVGLSLGAGFYEELFFRLILIYILHKIFQAIFGDRRQEVIKWVVIFLSAVLFSAVHYIGNLGDSFSLYSFIFRFFFGLVMNLLLIWRKFGITAWTHALYDIWVYF